MLTLDVVLKDGRFLLLLLKVEDGSVPERVQRLSGSESERAEGEEGNECVGEHGVLPLVWCNAETTRKSDAEEGKRRRALRDAGLSLQEGPCAKGSDPLFGAGSAEGSAKPAESSSRTRSLLSPVESPPSPSHPLASHRRARRSRKGGSCKVSYSDWTHDSLNMYTRSHDVH